MLKIQTIEMLEEEFNGIETELSELGILPAPSVEVINLDLIRVHINAEVNAESLVNYIGEILAANHEKGPLKIHVNAASSCNLIYNIDISTI